MDVAELEELAKRHQRGLVTEDELAGKIRTISTSISFASAIKSFEALYGPPAPAWHDSSLPLNAIDATQPCLEYAKLHLVRWLFAKPQDFERLNRNYFPNYPISVIRLGNGRYAIIDGHHRLWQAGVLFGPDSTVTLRVVNSRNPSLVSMFRSEVTRIAESNGSAELRRIPIRGIPDVLSTGDPTIDPFKPRWLDQILHAEHWDEHPHP